MCQFKNDLHVQCSSIVLMLSNPSIFTCIFCKQHMVETQGLGTRLQCLYLHEVPPHSNTPKSFPHSHQSQLHSTGPRLASRKMCVCLCMHACVRTCVSGEVDSNLMHRNCHDTVGWLQYTYFDNLMTVAQPTTQCSGPTDSSATEWERG